MWAGAIRRRPSSTPLLPGTGMLRIGIGLLSSKTPGVPRVLQAERRRYLTMYRLACQPREAAAEQLVY